MALINVDLIGSGETVINEHNAASGDLLNLNVLSSGTLVVDNVDVTLQGIVGVGAISSPKFAVQNGGSLTIDQGLLSVDVLTSPQFEIRDDGTLKLDASVLSVGLTKSLLNTFNVSYTGQYHTGNFIYAPSAVSLLQLVPQTFSVNGMQATDTFTIEGRSNFKLSTKLFGGDSSAYRDGMLHLTSTALPLLGETINVKIPMTQAEFDLFLKNKGQYLKDGTFTFPGILPPMLCFAAGTLIAAEFGEKCVETLRLGDLVHTADNGLRPIVWIGKVQLSISRLARDAHLKPVKISAGALGDGIPSLDLLLSPQHRVLIRSKIARNMFDTNEVLVAAKHLTEIDGIEVSNEVSKVEYYHIMFDRHEILISNGAETESLFLGAQAMKSIGTQAWKEICELFPEIDFDDFTPAEARRFTTGREARALALRHMRHDRYLVTPALLPNSPRFHCPG